MANEIWDLVAKFRLVIGYLGEKSQYSWWQSSFFTKGSEAFISPLFGRTQVLARCNGVTQAAALIHDERIGFGNVYHLFRLPEEMEQKIHLVLHNIEPNQVVVDKEAALEYLQKKSIKTNVTSVGPTRVGDKKTLYDSKTWMQVAGLYLQAFEEGAEIYPYFSDIS